MKLQMVVVENSKELPAWMRFLLILAFIKSVTSHPIQPVTTLLGQFLGVVKVITIVLIIAVLGKAELLGEIMAAATTLLGY